MSFPEPGRLAAHVFLDAASIYEPDNTESLSAATNLALERFNAIDGLIHFAGDSLDLSDFAGAAMTTITILCQRYAIATGRELVEVVSEMREYWDADL